MKKTGSTARKKTAVKKPAVKKPAAAARAKPGAGPRPAAGRTPAVKRRGQPPRAALLAAGPPAGRKKAVRPRPAPVTSAADVRLLDMQQAAVQVILDKKGRDLKRFDLRPLGAFTDFLLIASGDSGVQNRAIAEGIEERLRESLGVRPIGLEGRTQGDWVLIDYGGLVINLFTPAARAHYALERLWADAAQVE